MAKKYVTKQVIRDFITTFHEEHGRYPELQNLLNQFPHKGKNPKRHKDKLEVVLYQYIDKDLSEREDEPAPTTGGTMDDPSQRRIPYEPGVAKTYIFTCAQNNTDLMPEEWWQALMLLASAKGAEVHVSRMTYNKAAYGSHSAKIGTQKASDDKEIFYTPEIEQYVSDEDIQLAPDLVWLGSLNVTPTVQYPLDGFKNHTRAASCIVPHPKMQMLSVPTMKNDPAKLMYSTGCVTQMNYIQKAAGQKAEFHHVFGGVIVEVNEAGDWWVRQLNFDKSGTVYDLDIMYTARGAYTVSPEAITHGDIHGWKMDKDVCESVFGPAGLLDTLTPKKQFFHDVIDFMPRNHHNRKQFAFMHDMFQRGQSKVSGEFDDMAFWLMHDAHRSWCESFIVVSNHDQAINNWLDDRSGLDDPENLELWLKLNLARVTWPKRTFHPFQHYMTERCRLAVRLTAPHRKHPTFILEDESYKICGEIEAGLHGHLGPNGARGNPRNLRSIGKANTAHTHSAGIVDGIYTAGVLGQLDMEYNKGPSSWSHSSILTHPNAKRQILTYRAGKWYR